MNTEKLANSRIGKLFIRIMAGVMESKLRYRFFGPLKILKGSGIKYGHTVLEIGCGTGFFTIPAAQLIGAEGRLVAMDILQVSVDAVSKKVQTAKLNNVQVVKGDVLNTMLDEESFDTVLLFGVLPAPMLPLNKVLVEIHRVLKKEGIMSIWPPSWVPKLIPRSGLFAFIGKKNNVYNFRRC